MSDYVFLAIVLAAIGVSIVSRASMKRAMRRYKPEGALAEVDAVEGQPFTLALPAGPCELMIRYVIEGIPRSGRSGVDVGLTVLVEVTRPAPDGSSFEYRAEVAMGSSAPKLGAAERVTSGLAYAVERDGVILSATRVLAKLPDGGAGELRGRVEIGYGRPLGFTVFARAI